MCAKYCEVNFDYEKFLAIINLGRPDMHPIVFSLKNQT